MSLSRSRRAACLRDALLLAGLVLTASGCALHPSAPAPAIPPAPAWSLDRSTLDPSAAPCDDFYQYACGGFARAPLPPDREHIEWAGDALDARVHRSIGQLLTGRDRANDRELARLRTFYAACTADEASRDRAAAPAMQRWLARIDAAATTADLAAVQRELQAIGVAAWFSYDDERDPNQRDRHRGTLGYGSLGMRTSEYADPLPRAAVQRDTYRLLIARLFEETGEDPARAQRDSAHVLAIEAELAAAEPPLYKMELRDLEHPLPLDGLSALAPHVDWAGFLALVGSPAGRAVNAAVPSYFKALDHVLASHSIDELRAALRWRFLDGLGDALPSRLAEERRRFDAPAGIEPRPRSEDCELATMRALGVELSRQFALRDLGPAGRAAADRVIAGLQARMADKLATTPWLSTEARATIIGLVGTIDRKVGYPDTWPATGELALSASYLDDVLATRSFEQARTWRRAQAPWRRTDWEMMVYPNAGIGMAAARLTIPNGYPDLFSNSIIIPAAELQPPMFDPAAPLEVQYGAFGALVGHELTHLLDFYHYDLDGEVLPWWTPRDAEGHDTRARCVIQQADQFSLPGGRLSGVDTVNENTADLSGVAFAYDALAHEVGDRLAQRGSDGFTTAQRFFVAYAQRWCVAETAVSAERNLQTDHHGPPRFRVNGPLANLPEFAAAFSCRADQRMARTADERCALW